MDAKQRMQQHLVENLVKLLLDLLSPEMIKSFTNNLLTFAETYIQNTPNKYDDLIIGGMCQKIRSVFDIPKISE